MCAPASVKKKKKMEGRKKKERNPELQGDLRLYIPGVQIFPSVLLHVCTLLTLVTGSSLCQKQPWASLAHVWPIMALLYLKTPLVFPASLLVVVHFPRTIWPAQSISLYLSFCYLRVLPPGQAELDVSMESVKMELLSRCSLEIKGLLKSTFHAAVSLHVYLIFTVLWLRDKYIHHIRTWIAS